MILVIEEHEMHIIVADAQSTVRSAIRLLLEHQPESNIIEEAANIQELLNNFRRNLPDMLLIDWELLGIEPDKLLARLRVLHPNLIIIVLNSKPQTRQIALAAGADEFVSKNDPPERLLAAMRSHA